MQLNLLKKPVNRPYWVLHLNSLHKFYPHQSDPKKVHSPDQINQPKCLLGLYKKSQVPHGGKSPPVSLHPDLPHTHTGLGHSNAENDSLECQNLLAQRQANQPFLH